MTLPSSPYSCVDERLGRSPAVTSRSSRRKISIHLRQPIARQSYHRPCCPHGLGHLQLDFHRAGIIKMNSSYIVLLSNLYICPMSIYKYKKYIIYLFSTRENSFVAKIVGNRCQDFVMSLLGRAVNIGLLRT